MKCPERFNVTQQNIRKTIVDKDDVTIGEYHLLIENQGFAKCYEEDCAAWDKDKKICKKQIN